MAKKTFEVNDVMIKFRTGRIFKLENTDNSKKKISLPFYFLWKQRFASVLLLDLSQISKITNMHLIVLFKMAWINN